MTDEPGTPPVIDGEWSRRRRESGPERPGCQAVEGGEEGGYRFLRREGCGKEEKGQGLEAHRRSIVWSRRNDARECIAVAPRMCGPAEPGRQLGEHRAGRPGSTAATSFT